MKCYICAQMGKSTDAVAICIICGMGTCMEHTIRREVDVWEDIRSRQRNSRRDPADALPGLQCLVQEG